ncbi:hypothetical protein F0562_028263 [Nyssa sinensis]|uniref:Uncharacterized protein n=1 Tax=Nyssa sinensis TaxID=561372 RepID=A0A5J5B5X3_9ASTE|nr:hypothetical protein F0562_028263 [Nyssa sinensis]
MSQFRFDDVRDSFSQFKARTILREQSVVVDDFRGTTALRQFMKKGWLPLLSLRGPIDYPLVREFYANLESVEGEDLARGTQFDISPTIITTWLGITRSFEGQQGVPPNVDNFLVDDIKGIPPMPLRAPQPRATSSSLGAAGSSQPVTQTDLDLHYQHIRTDFFLPLHGALDQ